MTDEERMAACQHGDMAAFEELVNAWYDRALHYAGALIGDLAEDAVQDCFAALYLKRQQYNPALAFEGYFKSLLRYKCIDVLRKYKRSPILVALEQDMATDASPENTLVCKLYHQSLLGAVLALPQEQRELIIAYALENKSYQALAQQFNLSVAQIKIRLHRTRKLLKHIKEEWQ